jgi:hypothetical protein
MNNKMLKVSNYNYHNTSMDSYLTIVNKLFEINAVILDQPNKDEIISKLIVDGHLTIYRSDLTQQTIYKNRSVDEYVDPCGNESDEDAKYDTVDIEEEERDDEDAQYGATEESDDEAIEESDSEDVQYETIKIDAEVIEEQVRSYHKEECSELMVEIVTKFLCNLVNCDDVLTSTAFMHRCYLSFAKKHHKTNAKVNVIQKVDEFKKILRNVVGSYEVKSNGRSKGWKLGVPK